MADHKTSHLDLGCGWSAELRDDGIAVAHKDGGLHMADSFEQHMIRRLAGVEAERDKLRAAREADAEAMRRAMLALQSLWLHGDAAAAIANPAIEDLRARLEAVPMKDLDLVRGEVGTANLIGWNACRAAMLAAAKGVME